MEGAQIETSGPPTAGTEVAAPVFTGRAEALWVGFASVILLFVATFILVLRARTRRQPHEEADLFQPAGTDAEITFDDPLSNAGQAPAKRPSRFSSLFARKRESSLLSTERVDDEGLDDQTDAEIATERRFEAQRAEAQDAVFEDVHPIADGSLDPAAMDEVREAMLAETARRRAEAEAVSRREAALAEMERRARADAEEAEAQRASRLAAEQAEAAIREELEHSRLEERRRLLAQTVDAARTQERTSPSLLTTTPLAAAPRDDAAMLAAIDARIDAMATRLEARIEDLSGTSARHAESGDELYRTLAAVEDALLAQSEALKAETRNLLDSYAERLDRRLSAFSAPAGAASPQGDPVVAADALSSRALLDMFAQRLVEHREAIGSEMARLADRIERLAIPAASGPAAPAAVMAGQSPQPAAATGIAGLHPPMAPSVQLADIVKSALPATAFTMNARLCNNRKADCLIRLTHPPGPIAIDAHFPVDAWHRLHRMQAGEDALAEAENEYRRAVLRHIVDIAERLIVPDETAESALMFAPSETIFAELHSRFPDLVQDSYRARVWIVSPTSLMATLHTIRAVLRDARSLENVAFMHSETEEVLAELDQLRVRVSALEESVSKTHDEVREVVSSADQVYRRAETITDVGRGLAEERWERGARRILAERDGGPPAADAEPTRPLFPLR